MSFTAIWLTIRLAAATAAILLVLGLPLAWWLATTRRRWRFIIEALVAMPIILPPTVIGFYLLIVLSPRGYIGSIIESLGIAPLPFSFTGILLGSVLFNLPFAVAPFKSAFASIDRSYIEAARGLGARLPRIATRIVLPLAWPGILTGIVLSFAHTIGEFGVVLMLGGNIPGATQTLSIMIYDDVQALNYTAAHQTSLMLLIFSFITLCGLYATQRRVLPI